MKLLIYLLCALSVVGCETVPPRPATIVIYDTLESQATRFRTQYNLPREYELIFEKDKGVYVVKYHWDDTYNTEAFLSMDPQFNIVDIYWTRKYAQEFKKPLDAVKVIKIHYATILADRARKNPKP